MSVSQPTCPLCGGPIHDTGEVLVAPAECLVMVGARTVQLTIQQMTIFLALWRNRPRLHSAEQLLAVTAPTGRDDERDAGTIQVQIVRMRRALEPVGIRIDGVHGRGWRILHKAA